PIPGTKSSTRIVENAHAVTFTLTQDEVATIAAAATSIEGDRYASNKHTFNARLDKA
ncbi:hypothetical protein DYB26_012249, partial [Aphanomyces astaci]